jgi:hypothetical protein
LPAASALGSSYFFQRGFEARRVAGVVGDGPAASAARKQTVTDVGTLRRDGEMKSCIDLFFPL